MPSTGLHGPYTLDASNIDQKAEERLGAYALGYIGDDGLFYVQRIGRSDVNLNSRLHDYIGDYRVFQFGHFQVARDAFNKECNLYHDFDPPDNKIHPDRPNGTKWTCPRCRIFD